MFNQYKSKFSAADAKPLIQEMLQKMEMLNLSTQNTKFAQNEPFIAFLKDRGIRCENHSIRIPCEHTKYKLTFDYQTKNQLIDALNKIMPEEANEAFAVEENKGKRENQARKIKVDF